MYNAPLYDGLRALSGSGATRFHMPGHKGLPLGTLFDAVYAIDYTELPATGNLYEDGGLIQQAEACAAQYYQMGRCLFLTCGATQGVKAAIAAFCQPGGAIVIDRNCHKSVLDGCALLDLHPAYVVPSPLADYGVTGEIAPDTLRQALLASGAKCAIVTSPTYYGVCLDIGALAQAAHSCGATLLVDAAHGAHLRACGVPDACACGADAVVLSAHKTLPTLTQGAMLMLRSADDALYHKARRYTALFGTSSPSYPILASIDLSRAFLEEQPELYQAAAACARACARHIEETTPFRVLPAGDPCRLTIQTAASGIAGFTAGDFLRAHHIEPELCDRQNVVCIVTYADGEQSLARLTAALQALAAQYGARKCVPTPLLPPCSLPEAVLSPREACLAPQEARPLCESVGQVAAQMVVPYPPGVPVIAYGERISQLYIEYLRETGYNVSNKVMTVNHIH